MNSNNLHSKKNSIIFYKIPYFLILLLPFSLIAGRFPSDLSISIIAIIFLINIVLNELKKYYNNIFFKIFILIWIFLIFNSFIHEFNLDSYRISISYIRFGLFTICLWYIIDIDKKILKKLFYVYFICFSILIIDGLIQYYTGQNILGYELYIYGPRVSSFFGDELIMGSYLSRLYPIFIALFFFTFKNLTKIHYIGIILFSILIEIMVILTGERTSFFYINLFFLFLILFTKKIKIKNKLKIIGVITILFTIFFNLNDAFKNRIIGQTLEQMGYVKSIDKKNQSDLITKKFIFSETHHYHYLTSINIIKNNLFFGVGIKNYKKVCEKYSKYYYLHDNRKFDCKTHPHNNYLQIFLETGILGFLIVTSSFILLLINLIQLFKKKQNNFIYIQLSLLGAILITLWPLVPTGNFFNNYLSIIFYLPVGIYLWFHNYTQKYD